MTVAAEVSRLGVKSVYTPRGMTSSAWQEGLRMCAESSDGGAAGGAGGGKQKHKQHKQKVSSPSRRY